ncbi:MAG: tRNA threonylcarbamoyladenosine dehydratase, partial [Muribaculaceae bacterium]|nr:tRNA threonylcarbamoyladenosine dehydratase [Muribaculaceae bacterium]
MMDEILEKNIYSRSELLLGEGTMRKLHEKKVIVFGIGGVGSWTAEALVRTGVTHLTIVDADRVAASNINRQAPATVPTVGRPKTEAMLERLLSLNPHAQITAIQKIYNAETAADFHLEEYDYVIDAIDSLSDKVLLIYNATRARNVKFYSSMGAALKCDPTRIQVAEFGKVTGCRLAAAIRRKIKKTGMHPARKFRCVYSDELLPNLGDITPADAPSSDAAPLSYGKAATNGSLCHITAIFGMTLAGLVIQDICKS